MKNGIYIVATPIGNLQDISSRAKEVLNCADVIACEDTRIAKKLFSLLGLDSQKSFIRLDDNTEQEQSQKIVDLILSGKAVALISDAGSPLISDPGFKLIRLCRKQGIYVCSIPGACAVICALQLSGLPTNRFMFAGFIPNRDKARKDLFLELKDINATLVFYETANRIVKTLNAAKEVFADREISVAREITKVYEECINGTADELILHFSSKEPKGEIVVMVSPPTEKDNKAELDIISLLKQELSRNSLKTAVKNIVSQYNLNKNEVYELALQVKNEQL